MSFFGDSDEKRRRRERADLDTNYYKRQKIYTDAKEAERERLAKLKGIADAHQIANKKPLYQRIMGAATALGKDVMAGASKTNPDVFFSFDKPKPKRKRRRKKK